ncbi:Tn3 family transposase [Bacteroidota bacterium]
MLINERNTSDSDSIKIKRVRELFENKESKSAYDEILEELSKLEKTNLSSLKEHLFYEQLSKGYRRINNRVGGIIQILEFNPNTSDLKIMEAIQNYQKRNGKISNNAPFEFIKQENRKRIWSKEKEFNSQMYKIILFIEAANHIKSGTLNLKYTDEYKSAENFLIPIEKWKKSKQSLIERAQLNINTDFKLFIEKSKEELKKHYIKTNDNIENNKYLKFTKDGKSKIFTPKDDKPDSDRIIDLLRSDDYLPLIKVLSDVGSSSDFLSSFTHYNRKNFKKSPDDKVFYAGIIALGCNIGVHKMGKISKGIGSDVLDYTIKWYFSKENIDDANKQLIFKIDELSLSKIHINKKNELHTSSDGQKFNVSVPSIHANYSYKYFGSGKGVTAYSFIDEKSKLFYNTVISSTEREAGNVIDGLMHDEDTGSTIHSTDTHGFSEIAFAITNCLGIFFAPRIKNYSDLTLYTFKDQKRKKYEEYCYKILPDRSKYINENIIEEQWDNILRLLVTIKLRETTASKLLKRLSSYPRQHPLNKAIKEVGRIYKSIFILIYLNDLSLRQSTEKMLNKIEQSHQFAKALFFGNNQEISQETKEDQEVVVSNRHLIQNAIILWNYLKLSDILSKIEDENDFNNILNIVKSSSVMSWQHINLHGEYDFNSISSDDPKTFNMDKISSLEFIY